MATAKTKSTAAGPATKGLKVVSAVEGFRRGGRAFGREATVVPLSELTNEQLDAIKGEPSLAVVEVDIEPAKE
jgi:hypothetical protein